MSIRMNMSILAFRLLVQVGKKAGQMQGGKFILPDAVARLRRRRFRRFRCRHIVGGNIGFHEFLFLKNQKPLSLCRPRGDFRLAA